MSEKNKVFKDVVTSIETPDSVTRYWLEQTIDEEGYKTYEIKSSIQSKNVTMNSDIIPNERKN